MRLFDADMGKRVAEAEAKYDKAIEFSKSLSIQLNEAKAKIENMEVAENKLHITISKLTGTLNQSNKERSKLQNDNRDLQLEIDKLTEDNLSLAYRSFKVLCTELDIRNANSYTKPELINTIAELRAIIIAKDKHETNMAGGRDDCDDSINSYTERFAKVRAAMDATSTVSNPDEPISNTDRIMDNDASTNSQSGYPIQYVNMNQDGSVDLINMAGQWAKIKKGDA